MILKSAFVELSPSLIYTKVNGDALVYAKFAASQINQPDVEVQDESGKQFASTVRRLSSNLFEVKISGVDLAGTNDATHQFTLNVICDITRRTVPFLVVASHE